MKAKTILYVLLCLTFACSEESLITPDAPSETLALEERGVAEIVLPSGDLSGVTDADAIENALNGDGVRVVILGEGTFYINRPVVAPAGFEGALRGQGENTTSVIGVGTAGSTFQRDWIHVPGNPGPIQASTFFYFPDPANSLILSGFSLSIPNGFEAEVSELEGTANLTSFITVKLGIEVADVTLNNIKLTGAEALPGSPPWYFSQPNFGAVVLGDRDASDFPQPSHPGGKIKIQECEVSKTGFQALLLEVLKDAKINVSQSDFSDTKQINIRFLDGCQVKVQDNTFKTNFWGSIVVTQERALGYGPIYGAPTDVKVLDNQITSNGFLGVEIGAIPFPDAAPFDILIEGNTIAKGPAPNNGSNVAGIGIYQGHENAVVQYNTLLGEGEYGILFREVSNSEAFRNATAGFAPATADYGLLGTSNDNEVTVTDPSTVIDEGSGNVFVGPVTIL